MIQIGDIYYSPDVKKLYSVVGIHDDYLICTGFSEYTVDAERNILRQTLSYDFVNASILVKVLDKLPFLEPSVLGWKVKED